MTDYRSETEAKQAELREALFLSENLEDDVHPNTALLLRTVILNRNIYETQRLIDVVNRAKAVFLSEGH